MYTYKVGGAQIGVEKEIISQIAKRIGYPEESGGTFPTGGSLSNFMGLLMARDHHNPEVRHSGVQQTMIAYSSIESHYSIAKNASFAGIGRDNVRYIATNQQAEMRADLLETQIKKDIQAGLTPFFVNATAGTTVLGAYDPLEELSVICKKYGLWLHCDAALGGAAMFSEQYRYLLKGCELTDSFSFNAHKMLGVPLSCSMILVRNKKHLYQSFSNEADYLYQGDDDDLNLGKMSLQCGRRNDALKFWTLWKSVGTKGLEQIVDSQFELSAKANEYIQSNPDYTLYSRSPSIAVCFNYKNIDPKLLCKALYKKQEILVSHGSFDGTAFVRLVAVNAKNEVSDIIDFFHVLEEFVEREAETWGGLSSM
jgi:sulfinoalanine decarboxylase/sulfinoalanine decarboxylase/aspartate 1-decarboxylase